MRMALYLALLLPALALAQHIEEEAPEAYQDPRVETPEHHHTDEPAEHSEHGHAHDDRLPAYRQNEVSGHSLMDDNDFPLPHMMDDDAFWMIMVDELEVAHSDSETAAGWDAEAWWGPDLHRIWFKTEAEREHSEFEDLELQLLYSRAVSPFWNLQVGLRHDVEPESRQWLALAAEGLAPYWFHSEASLFVTDGGQAELRLEADYELLLTQRLILTPDIEVSLFAEDEPHLGMGAGLSSAELALRLRYEIRREFAPYLGIRYERLFGDTRDLASDAGEASSDWALLAGLRFWL